MDFKLVSDYAPTGDQPEAIAQLLASIRHGSKHNTLLGVTGSGKTFTVANVISQLNRPTLVLSHNKTLAAQLYGEFKNFFPENAVEYFVSYYDYYQPEAYLPSTDTYIEKDLSINDEIEKMRLSTTATLLSGRRDVIVVSSVSCLYGCGNPSDFHSMAIHIEVGEILNYKQFLYKLVEALYTRTERELTPATFRVTGDTIDIMAAFGEFGNQCFRVTFFDNEVESIQSIDPVTGQRIQTLDALTLYPVSLFVTTKERIHTAVQQIYLDLGKQIAFFEQAGRPAEAQRIKQRVEYDLEMIKELGYCPGIENYSRYFDGRAEGTRPFCLLDYFPQDYLMVIDESHVTLPQVHAMFGGDRARKENLVEYGFRLPAAKDNRPLRFEEFEQLVGTTIYVSATPADYELMKSEGVIVEQLIRPTGLVDPPLEVRITDNQIDDLLEEIDKRVRNDDKILVTTITKRMAEELSKYFDRVGVRNRYIHSDIDTLERVQILEDLFRRVRELDQIAALDRLHDNHGLSMLAADPVAFAALDRGVVEVDVVELNLHDLNLRVLAQDFIQHLRPVVEGNADVADFPLLFQFERRLIGTARLEVLENLCALGVHQVKVEIIYAADFQLAFKKRTNILFLFEICHRQLVGQNEPVSRIAAGKTCFDCLLALALQIAVCSIKIVKARVQERIDHPAGLLDVHLAVLHRKAHVAEAEVLFDPVHLGYSFPVCYASVILTANAFAHNLISFSFGSVPLIELFFSLSGKDNCRRQPALRGRSVPRRW